MRLLNGDCVNLIDEVEDGIVDMILTDPPYSSGGIYAGDRKNSTKNKYTDSKFNGASAFHDFSGDNMDQMSFMWFMYHVLAAYRNKLKPGGIMATFIDWRQIAAMITAMQMAGIVYRGIVVWDKGNSRNTPHRFRNDCEYIVWGTSGQRAAKYEKGIEVFPGCYHIKGMNTREKHHQTEKPTELLRKLIKIVPEGGTVMDMFMGSGSVGVACKQMNRDFVGIELDPIYYNVACDRIHAAHKGECDDL